MDSLEKLTTRCDHIGQQLATWALSGRALVDRASALIVLASTLEELMAKDHAPVTPVHGAVRVRQEIEAARMALHAAATDSHIRVQTRRMEPLRERLLGAQGHLVVACRLLAETQ